MKSSIWKWMLGISLVLLVLLTVFTVGIWAMGNAAGAIVGGIMEATDPDNFGYRYLPLDDFLVNAIGSPMFYIYIADLAVFMGSVVMLILTRKKNNGPSRTPVPTGAIL